jgi:hypothetical protein
MKDAPKAWQSTGAMPPDKEHVVHFARATAQLGELPATGDGTLEISNAASECWDAASRSRNSDSKNAGVGLASVHD